MWKERIIAAFVARYPASRAASGGRDLRLSVAQLFPDFDRAPPDERESFLEAAEALEKSGLLSITWVRGKKHEAISALVLRDALALFAAAGLPSPRLLVKQAREASLTTDIRTEYRSLFTFLAEHLTPEDAASGIDAAAVHDLHLLTNHLSANSGNAAGITPRALSVRLFADSKRLEHLTNLFRVILRRADAAGVVVPDFLPFERSFPETLIAGKIRITFHGEDTPLENSAGSILGLPLSTIQKISHIEAIARAADLRRVLTVENKETFYALSNSAHRKQFDCIVYAGGHPNRAVHALVAALARSGFRFAHAGDLDPDGILILQELMDIVSIACNARSPVEPFRMDAATFDLYAVHARLLKQTMLRRLSFVSDPTRALPGIGGLIARIAESGRGVEQEIIDYDG
jgi:hypothetical protein